MLHVSAPQELVTLELTQGSIYDVAFMVAVFGSGGSINQLSSSVPSTNLTKPGHQTGKQRRNSFFFTQTGVNTGNLLNQGKLLAEMITYKLTVG